MERGLADEPAGEWVAAASGRATLVCPPDGHNATGGRLRLRVFIGETAAALHDVRWDLAL